MSPQLKKVLSSAGFAAIGAVLVSFKQELAVLPPIFQTLGASAILYIAHSIDAWGHTQRVEQAVVKAVAEVIDAEVQDSAITQADADGLLK